MFTVFIVIQILLTLALVGMILVQRNDSDGLGSMGGGGGGNAFMTGRGAANFMTRSTAIIATLFMLNSLWLAILSTEASDRPSLAEEIETTTPSVSVPLAEEPAATSAPAAETPVEVAPAEEAPVEVAPAEETPSTPTVPAP